MRRIQRIGLKGCPTPDRKKIHAMPNMSGVVARLCREFQRASGVISLAPNSAHHDHRFLRASRSLGAQYRSPENSNTVTSSKSTRVNHLHTISSRYTYNLSPSHNTHRRHSKFVSGLGLSLSVTSPEITPHYRGANSRKFRTTSAPGK